MHIKRSISEMFEFSRYFSDYFKQKILTFGRWFDRLKDLIVAVLVVKRGKYSSSFLNTSFILLIGATIIGGPVIAQNNPFISDYIIEESTEPPILATDVGSISFETTISEKPRDKVIEYEVQNGDTLASVAEKFDVSVNSIKWASGLKGDTIKVGSILKVPPVTGIVHTVKSGESIYSIAKRYSVEPQAILNFPFNEYADPESFALRAGQTIYVPDGVPPADRPRLPAPLRAPQFAAGQPGTGNFIWPASGYVSQSPVWYHMALDIANKELPPVLAADTGTVSYVAQLGYGYGWHIIVDHGNGFQTLYGHLSRIDVSAGQGVGKGQTIGRVGTTGRSTGPHLHFEVRQSGRLLNPLSFLGQ